MTFRKAKIGCFGIALLLVGFVAGVASAYYSEKHARDQKIADRLDGATPIRPVYLRDRRDCKDLSQRDRHLDQVMLDAAAVAASDNPSFVGPVQDDVVSYFAWHWSFYGNGRCPPSDEIVGQLTPTLERVRWPQSSTELNDLRLAERLPAGESLAARLATIGFLNWIPPSNLTGEDARPYARQLLAEQGKFALPWSKQALNEVGGDSRLGTSAAYLAVATNQDRALPIVQQIMIEKLRRSRERQVRAFQTGGEVSAIRPDDANRLIELGYALARAGAKAEPYSQPIVNMLAEKIARPAPPFGLLVAQPTEFCRIARHIGGRIAREAEAKSFCSKDFKGGDGAPRQF